MKKDQKNNKEKTIIHLTWTEHKTITHTKLHIKINHKTAQEMADKYNFSNNQREQMNELLKDDYIAMWSSVIYGSSGSSESEGVAWFQACGLWQNGGYTPKLGDIIFFDWADKKEPAEESSQTIHLNCKLNDKEYSYLIEIDENGDIVEAGGSCR